MTDMTNEVSSTVVPIVPTSLVRDGDTDATRQAILAAEADEAEHLGIAKEDVTGEVTARPDGVPEKFWDAEKGQLRTDELLKSYGELEAKLGAPKEPGDDADKAAADDAAKPDDKAQEIADFTGLDFASYTDEFTKGEGKLSDGSRTAIISALEARMKMDNESATALLDGYLEGLQLRTAGETNRITAEYQGAVTGLAGGPVAYGEMITWAADNLTPEEIKDYDEAVNSGTLSSAKFAAKDLIARFKKAQGPNLIQGKTSGVSGGDTYATRREMTDDMGDPRYDTSAKFRAEVNAKIERSVSVIGGKR